MKDLGYKNNEAQLLTVPPYVVACFFCISAGYLSDRLQTRGIIMIAFNLVAIIGLSMLVSSDNPHVKYAGTFFFASGVYPNVPQCMAWNGNNTGGSTKRSISIAMQAMTGNLVRLFLSCHLQIHRKTFADVRRAAYSQPSYTSNPTARSTPKDTVF